MSCTLEIMCAPLALLGKIGLTKRGAVSKTYIGKISERIIGFSSQMHNYN